MVFQIDCPIEETYDVVVCGGGPAGFSAALCAARNGAKVALVEQMGYLGGTGTVNGVNVFSHGYHDGQRLITAGIFMEVYNELLRRDALIPHWQRGWEPFNMETYKLLLDEWMKEAGVDVYLESSLVCAALEGDRITHVMINTLKGPCALAAKQFVDATGDGHLAMMAGVPYEVGREGDGAIQPYTMMFFVGGVDFEALKHHNRLGLFANEDGRTYINGNGFRPLIDQANKDGLDYIPKKTIGSLYNIPWLPGVVGVNFSRIFADTNLDPRRLFEDSHIGRKQVQEAMEILRKYFPGFENAYLIETSPKVGRRESRRITGLYTMTVEDVSRQNQFEDVIAQACYQIDIHNPTDAGSSIVRIPEGKHYDIPFRALIPINRSNLLVAGRCVSATHEALAAIRVQHICMAMGQAAGTAAAMCAQLDVSPSTLDVSKLQRCLADQGVILD